MQEDWKIDARIDITIENKSKKVVLEMTSTGCEFLINELKKLLAGVNASNVEEFDGDTYADLGLFCEDSYGLVIIKNDQMN